MTDAPTTPDPIEIAMEAEARGVAPAGEASGLLREQRRLVRWEIADKRAGFALKVLVGLAGLALAAALGVMAWQASRADGVVVEAFSAPPDMAAEGLSGQVLASQLRDRLDALNAATHSGKAGSAVTDSWTREVSIQIPQTGVSIGELQRLLRAWLGHEIHVSGELYRSKAGVRLTVRASGRGASTVSGGPDDLDALLNQAAEAVYWRVSPYRYANWVEQQRGAAAARPLYATMTSAGSREDRAWAWRALSRTETDVNAALADIEAMRALKPRTRNADLERGTIERRLGHMEAALRGYELALTARPRNFPNFTQALIAEWRGDFRRAITYWRAWETTDEYAGIEGAGGVSFPTMLQARDWAELHETGRARAMLPPGLADAQLTSRSATSSGSFAQPNGWIARTMGDWAEMAREYESLDAVMSGPEAAYSPAGRLHAASSIRPRRAEALAHLGRIAEAQALIATTPADCYLCVIVRGEVAALAGDAAGADRWFAEAARQGPSLRDAFHEWAVAKLARGDAAGALALFREAERRAPRWADPLKGEGDALMRLGRTGEALKAYAAAAERAPRWGGLHLAWGAALAKAGKEAEVQARWRAAAGMDLTAPERAELARVLR